MYEGIDHRFFTPGPAEWALWGDPGSVRWQPAEPVCVDTIMVSQFPQLRRGIQCSTPHNSVNVIGGWDTYNDVFLSRIRCYRCDKRWSVWQRQHARATRQTFLQWHDKIVPYQLELIDQDDCFRLDEQGMIAEWLAKWLRSRKEKGVDLVECMDEAERLRLAPPPMVMQIIDMMGVLDEASGKLELPEGHPWRTW